MAKGTRKRRISRIVAAMPFAAELMAHTEELDSVWWARRSSSESDLWIAIPVSRNGRGDEALAESNYRVIKADLDRVAAFGTDYRVDLWPGGSIHTLMVRRDDALALRAVEQWVNALADYPIADESDYYEEQWSQNHPAADNYCYADADRECPCDREAA